MIQEQGCVGFQASGLGAGESEGGEMKERGELSSWFEAGRRRRNFEKWAHGHGP